MKGFVTKTVDDSHHAVGRFYPTPPMRFVSFAEPAVTNAE
jgi:hypothetical protein